jgi:hypothetical protein
LSTDATGTSVFLAAVQIIARDVCVWKEMQSWIASMRGAYVGAHEQQQKQVVWVLVCVISTLCGLQVL